MSRYRGPAERAKRAEKNYRLAGRLRDPRKLIAAFRFFDFHLKPGHWTIVHPWPPRREKSRKLNPGWDDALKAAKRILHLGVKWDRLRADYLDVIGKNCLAYYIRRDVWGLVSSRLSSNSTYGLSCRARPETEHLYISEQTAKRLDQERITKEHSFDDKLYDQDIELQFKALPPGFRMTPQLKALAHELGPMFMERCKAYLNRDWKRLQRSRPPSRSLAEPSQTAPELAKPPPSREEIYTKNIKQSVKTFMHRIQLRRR